MLVRWPIVAAAVWGPVLYKRMTPNIRKLGHFLRLQSSQCLAVPFGTEWSLPPLPLLSQKSNKRTLSASQKTDKRTLPAVGVVLRGYAICSMPLASWWILSSSPVTILKWNLFSYISEPKKCCRFPPILWDLLSGSSWHSTSVLTHGMDDFMDWFMADTEFIRYII